jgi:hypothetical protein
MNSTNLIEDFHLLPIPPWYQTPQGIAAIVVAAALAFWLYRKYLRKHRPADAIAPPKRSGPPPHEEYLRRLAALRTRMAQLTAYDLSIEVCEILRGYLEARFQFRILYQTSREFLDSIRADSQLNDRQRSTIDAFLSLCDAVKFARRTASTEEQDGLLQSAERLIRECSGIA